MKRVILSIGFLALYLGVIVAFLSGLIVTTAMVLIAARPGRASWQDSPTRFVSYSPSPKAIPSFELVPAQEYLASDSNVRWEGQRLASEEWSEGPPRRNYP